ncbi:hypothetical protein [Vibrio injensis]|uniref:hypothetical protein n=1 Tax=Vibrio injensis TaxID=1307414 RepID=UPI001428905A|nr:hypothetical protein [Vibrio injensis]
MMPTSPAAVRSTKPIEYDCSTQKQPLTAYYLQRLVECQHRSERLALLALIQLCQWQKE